MNITIISVGKLKERFWKDAIAEYSKRLRAYCKLHIIEVADRDPSKCGGVESAIKQEADDIFKTLSSYENARIILLAIEGKAFSSEEIAAHLQNATVQGTSDFVFIIGGSYGVTADVVKRADVSVSFGKITLPHNLARVVLLEQIYRAFKIMRSEPYHK